MTLGIIAAGLTAMGAAISSDVGDGTLVGHTVDSITRQPELQSRLQATMLIGVGLIETMPITAIVISFLVMNK